MDLSSLIADTNEIDLKTEVRFDIPGSNEYVDFLISYLDREQFTEISNKSIKTTFDPRTKAPTQTTDSAKFHKKLVDKFIHGWSKMTFRKLGLFVPLKKDLLTQALKEQGELQGKPATLDSEIAFNAQLLIDIIGKAYYLEKWLLDQMMNINLFQSDFENLDEELKKSEASSDGNPQEG